MLTGGLGLTGIRDIERHEDPTPRQAAIRKDIRDLVNLSDTDFIGASTNSQGRLGVEGWEYTALLRLAGLHQPITVKVLVPSDFDTERPTLIVAPSSGSRGATGAIGDIGLWALPAGCALALTDKGTGGAQILGRSLSFSPDFEPTDNPRAPTNFRLRPTTELQQFSQSTPHAIALKHAHSEENVEAFWPACVLAAGEYASEVLSRQGVIKCGTKDTGALKVIAAGVSNGGGAVLKAMESDTRGLLHAVVAMEPNITPRNRPPLDIIVGDQALDASRRTLIDYATAMNLIVPAALLSPTVRDEPFADVNLANDTRLAAWSKRVGRAGVLDGETHVERATDALNKIQGIGFPTKSNALLHAMAAMHIWPAVSHTYICAAGRYPVYRDPVNASVRFAKTDPMIQAIEGDGPANESTVRYYGALSGGLSPGGGGVTVYQGGDLHPNATDALELRRLATRSDPDSRRIWASVAETLASAETTGRPTVILHGRCDSLISINHSSRAYIAALSASGGDMRHVRYYEHEHGQHFESLLGVPGFASLFEPLLPAVFQALEATRRHLFEGTTLPPSQVIRTNRIDGKAKPQGRMEPIRSNPASDEIHLGHKQLRIPK
ncbi:MAG: 3-hydroxybutyrate oligomer hydrolase family protein [Pseudomonadota bacterium]